jgi:formylglycine-generating enzyme required for sulfatase activity
MGGDVFQWNETLISGSFRGLRGGSWYDNSGYLASSFRSSFGPVLENDGFGFRVAIVTEPGTAVLASIACGMIWILRKRRK